VAGSKRQIIALWLRKYWVVLWVALISILWLWTHLQPSVFGTCHDVPLNLGKEATARDCSPWPNTDFLAVTAVVFFPLLAAAGGTLSFTLPWKMGTVTVKQQQDAAVQEVESKEVATALKQGEDELNERADTLAATLPQSPSAEKDSGAEPPKSAPSPPKV
jgi:hypothetical protein